jgi:DNA-binding transcriptional ArsR family regulator
LLQAELVREREEKVSLERQLARLQVHAEQVQRLELLLAEGELSVSAMLRRLGIAQGRLSSHLACLRWCGYVIPEQRGRFTFYRVTDWRLRRIVTLGQRLAMENAAHLAACTRIDPPPRHQRWRQAGR